MEYIIGYFLLGLAMLIVNLSEIPKIYSESKECADSYDQLGKNTQHKIHFTASLIAVMIVSVLFWPLMIADELIKTYRDR